MEALLLCAKFLWQPGVSVQRGSRPILFSSASRALMESKAEIRKRRAQLVHASMGMMHGLMPAGSENLPLYERPMVDRRLATSVTKSRVEVLERWHVQTIGMHLNVWRKKIVKRDKTKATEQMSPAKLRRLNLLVETVCGIYTRVARRLGVHRSFVSRVAKGERRSGPVEQALVAEYERVDGP